MVVQQQAKCLLADHAAADVRMAVDARTKGLRAIVEVNRTDQFQAYRVIELPHRGLVVLFCADRVPGGKYVADITSTGNPGKWSHDEFIKALQTGITPEGKELNPQEMPWTITKSFTNDELTALHMYLSTLK